MTFRHYSILGMSHNQRLVLGAEIVGVLALAGIAYIWIQWSKKEEGGKKQDEENNERRQPTEVEPDRTERVRGLENIGNTCYFNSTMQPLVHTNSVFSETLQNLDRKGEFVKKVLKFLNDMQSENSRPYSPKDLHRLFGKKSPKFADFRQHDSHECLRNFLDNVRKEERDNSGAVDKRKVLTVVDSVFGGHFMTVYICKECETPYHVCEALLDISLPIMINEKDLDAMYSAGKTSRTVKQQTRKSQSSRASQTMRHKLTKSPKDIKSTAVENNIELKPSKPDQDTTLDTTLQQNASEQILQLKSKAETTEEHSTDICAEPFASGCEFYASFTLNEPEARQVQTEVLHEGGKLQALSYIANVSPLNVESENMSDGEIKEKLNEISLPISRPKYYEIQELEGEQNVHNTEHNQKHQIAQEKHEHYFHNTELDETHQKALEQHDGKHPLDVQPEKQHKDIDEQHNSQYIQNIELQVAEGEEEIEHANEEERQRDEEEDDEKEKGDNDRVQLHEHKKLDTTSPALLKDDNKVCDEDNEVEDEMNEGGEDRVYKAKTKGDDEDGNNENGREHAADEDKQETVVENKTEVENKERNVDELIANDNGGYDDNENDDNKNEGEAKEDEDKQEIIVENTAAEVEIKDEDVDELIAKDNVEDGDNKNEGEDDDNESEDEADKKETVVGNKAEVEHLEGNIVEFIATENGEDDKEVETEEEVENEDKVETEDAVETEDKADEDKGGKVVKNEMQIYCEAIDKLMMPLSMSSQNLPRSKAVEKKQVTICDCLKYFTRKEHIDKEYLCNGCYKKHYENGGEDILLTSATKQTLIFNPPAILTLHLKRFELKPGGSVKRTDMITYKELLDIAPYCSSMCLRNNPPCRNIWYSLYGVVVHHGSTLKSGHYMAYVKIKGGDAGFKKHLQEKFFDRDLTREQLSELMQEKHLGETFRQPGTWYCMNDSWFHEVSVEEVLNQEAYLLFYERM